MSNFSDLDRFVSDLTSFASSISLLITVFGVFCIIAPYFVRGYALMKTGHKAKVEGDFMPFIPIARQIYQMKIAGCPVWYIFLFGFTTITVGGMTAVCVLFYKVVQSLTLISVILIIYLIANRVFTFLYYQKYYKRFGFNPNTAWLNIIPLFTVIAQVFEMFIAFSNTIVFLGDRRKNWDEVGPVRNGVIVGVSGTYANASFDIADGAELVFGRDPQAANIVLDQTDTDVSRKHASIRFDARTNQYAVTDLNSSTGTYLENGTQIPKGQTQYVARGSVVYFGSTKKNAFRLN